MKDMRTKTFSALIVIVTSIALLVACRKTDSTPGNSIPNPTTPGTLITGSVAGRVTDLNNVPVSNAVVTAGTATTNTDVNGQFILRNVQLDKNAGFVKVTRTGYFEGSRTFLVNTNAVNNVKIELIPKTVSGNFPAGSGGTINVSGGGTVNFAANATVNASTGSAYTGTVSVSTFLLNPADANFTNYMPGNLVGINASNQQKILQSFGMVSVEMDDAGGNKLQIATGKTATITIPIPSARQAGAPATIPLWYFNDTTGIWKQEGSATKQNNAYVGAVAHFTFWTAGQLAQSVQLNAKFVFDTASAIIAVANRLVTITSANYGTTTEYTDSAGTVSGLVPANETLAMKVLNDCGDSIYGQNIGPFNTDTNLGTITVTSNTCYNPPAVIALSATLKDQNGNVLAGNLVTITNATFSDTSINTSSTGQFSIGVPSGESFVMKVYDQCGGIIYMQNIGPFTWVSDLGTITVTVTPPVSVILSGTVVDCNNNAVTNGSVQVSFGSNQFTSSIANGNFAITFNRCSGSPTPATITVYDVVTGQYIPAQPITVTNGNQDIGQIIIPCAAPDTEYINLTLNGGNYSWTPLDSLAAERVDSGSYYNTSIHGGVTGVSAPNPLKYILLEINNDNASPGTYNLNFYALLNDTTYNSGSLTTTVTEYGAVGGYISGTASGQVLQQAYGTYVSFFCNYRVKRTQ